LRKSGDALLFRLLLGLTLGYVFVVPAKEEESIK
jgi:hypothetical protein